MMKTYKILLTTMIICSASLLTEAHTSAMTAEKLEAQRQLIVDLTEAGESKEAMGLIAKAVDERLCLMAPDMARVEALADRAAELESSSLVFKKKAKPVGYKFGDFTRGLIKSVKDLCTGSN